jgi:deazaflavin-dependent oxidoreductase (nitroreductase family)
MAADDYCYLTTTGRRSGRPHRLEIWYAIDGETLFLLAGGGMGSDWVQNLVAEPAVTVEIGRETRAARGRVVDDPAEAERARSLVFEKYAPRYEGDLTDWRARALPVALDPVAPPGRPAAGGPRRDPAS